MNEMSTNQIAMARPLRISQKLELCLELNPKKNKKKKQLKTFLKSNCKKKKNITLVLFVNSYPTFKCTR